MLPMAQLKLLLQEVQPVAAVGLVPVLLGGDVFGESCSASLLSYHSDFVRSFISWASSLVSILNLVTGQ